jgi:hypothetical protein
MRTIGDGWFRVESEPDSLTEDRGATLVLQPRRFSYLLVAFNLSFHVIDDPNKTTAKDLMFALLLTGSFLFENAVWRGLEGRRYWSKRGICPSRSNGWVGCWKVGSWPYGN